MSEINILLYEQLAGLIRDITWAKLTSQHKLVCRLELYTPCAYTFSAPAPNVVYFSHFQSKFMAEK